MFDKDTYRDKVEAIYDGINKIAIELFEEIYASEDNSDFEMIADEIRETVYDIEGLQRQFHGLYDWSERQALLRQKKFELEVRKDLKELPLYTGQTPDEPDWVTRLRKGEADFKR